MSRIVYRVSRAGALFGGMLILAAALLIGFDVAIRHVFVKTIGSACTLGFTLLRRAHVRIDSLYVYLPMRFRPLLDIFGLTLFIFFMGLVTWHASGTLGQSIESDSHSISPLGTPLAIPQSLWVLGLLVFMVVALLLLLRAVVALVHGDAATVMRLIGSRSATEEVELEVQAVEESRAPGEAPE